MSKNSFIIFVAARRKSMIQEKYGRGVALQQLPKRGIIMEIIRFKKTEG